MKKLTLLAVITTVFIFGCSKQDSEIASPVKNVDETSMSVYQFSFDGNDVKYELVEFERERVQSQPEANLYKNGNSAHAHGDFHTWGGFVGLDFSATQNNGGTHGTGYLEMGDAKMNLETSSVIVIEGVGGAIYGGLITEVIDDGGLGFLFAEGRVFYMYLQDNGQGNNAPADQTSNILAVSPEPWEDAGAGVPWTIFGLADVTNPTDVIKVNND